AVERAVFGPPCSGRHGQGQIEGRHQRCRIGNTFAGNVECRAVVDAGAHEGQAHRDIDALIQAQVFHGYQALVVILGHHDVEFAAARAHEHGVAGPGTRYVQAGVADLGNGRPDDVDVFAPEFAVFARMRVQPGHGDARPCNAHLAARTVGEPDGAGFCL